MIIRSCPTSIMANSWAPDARENSLYSPGPISSARIKAASIEGTLARSEFGALVGIRA